MAKRKWPFSSTPPSPKLNLKTYPTGRLKVIDDSSFTKSGLVISRFVDRTEPLAWESYERTSPKGETHKDLAIARATLREATAEAIARKVEWIMAQGWTHKATMRALREEIHRDLAELEHKTVTWTRRATSLVRGGKAKSGKQTAKATDAVIYQAAARKKSPRFCSVSDIARTLASDKTFQPYKPKRAKSARTLEKAILRERQRRVQAEYLANYAELGPEEAAKLISTKFTKSKVEVSLTPAQALREMASA